MKKLFSTIALVAALAFSANAQVRVEALGNFSKLTFEDQSTNAEFGFGVRALYQLFDAKDFGVDAGLGYMFTKSSSELTHGTITLNNLQLPFHVNYTLDFGNVSIIPYVGFYAGYALSGKTSFDASVATIDTDPFEGEGGMKRFDFGSDDEILVKFGGHYTLGVGFEYSFINRCKSKDVNVDSDMFYFSIGYAF